MSSVWIQKSVRLSPKPRGFHLITREILAQIPEIGAVQVGILHVFIQHTSASLTINENADPDVRRDLDLHLDHLIPDGADHFIHTLEGEDDMPAHVKSSLLGSALSIPITEGRLALGTWQGVYLGEHRDYGGARQVVLTLHGQA